MVLSSPSALFMYLVISGYKASFSFLEYLQNGGLLYFMSLCLKIVSYCLIVVLCFICQGILCSHSLIKTKFPLVNFLFLFFSFILIALWSLLFCFVLAFWSFWRYGDCFSAVVYKITLSLLPVSKSFPHDFLGFWFLSCSF